VNAPCQNAARRNRAELDEVIVAALSVAPQFGQPVYHHDVLTRRPDGTVHAIGTVRITCTPAMPNKEVVAALRGALADREPEPSRDERTFHVLGAAGLLVAGAILGQAGALLVQWVGL
jgi:hypothetical protein